ncbi:hypothetical protein QCA50_001029 [Cerrena zonata]|uniref:Alanine dehydrogenase/pyridine nucleotide transhydrogenase N-terminal domain-containing protein n=1 Tax=Cerrena zonata TaxID=2478898 RepID=A0AAW0GT06_9APHY
MTVLRRTPFHVHRVTRRAYHVTRPKKLTIGIRREDSQRIWERRSPLVPEDVHRLVQEEDVDIVFQSCERRIWNESNELIRAAGARIDPTLASAHITLGVKEPPLNELLVNPIPSPYHEGPELLARTHLMFSHTIKGQMYNMELLSKFLASDGGANLLARLIDFELLTDENGKRTVGFGWYAGVAGALESLSALGHALLELGVASQFLYIPRPHTRRELRDIQQTLTCEPEVDLSRGTPKSVGPIVIGVTGSGNVSQGALDILQRLRHSLVKVDSLPSLISDPKTPLDRIYITHIRPEDYLTRQDGQPYNRSHYYSKPSEYSSEFHTKVAPYLTSLINGAGWAPSFPRLMTNEQLAVALEKAQQVGRGRFICVGDISCDVEGGLEFMPRASTLSAPFYKTRPASLPAHLPSITMMSVDILPTALPNEASKHFSGALYPYLKTLIRDYRETAAGGDYKPSGQERNRLDALHRATVARNGVLREPFQWLEGPLGVWRQSIANTQTNSTQNMPISQTASSSSIVLPEKQKKVLVLGSGMVAAPAIDEIGSWKDTQLVVASDILSEAQRLTARHSNASAVVLDVNDTQKVSELVAEADVVISLLPVPFHPRIAKLCIQHRKHMVTCILHLSRYESFAQRVRNSILSMFRTAHNILAIRAKESSVLLLNEIGLDPGIDHCSAISLFDDLRVQQKDIVSFTSFCGGLPAPENAEGVPLKYKFSWSPKGVLSAALNGARFKLWDQVHEISGTNLLKQRFPNLPISDVLKLEGLANRDSLPYGDTYNLGPLSGIRTLFRGTLRYEGFSELMDFFKVAGLLATDVKILPETLDVTHRRKSACTKCRLLRIASRHIRAKGPY